MNGHKRNDGLLEDYCDGSAFKEHPLFSVDPTALQIMLYYDDVEVHKLCAYLILLAFVNSLHNKPLEAEESCLVKCMVLPCFRGEFVLYWTLHSWDHGGITPQMCIRYP